jgi:hypothetical protein
MGCHVIEDSWLTVQATSVGKRGNDTSSHLILRWRNPYAHSPLKPTEQIWPEVSERLRFPVTGANHLSPLPSQSIEGLLKLDSRRPLTGEKL